MIGLRLPVLCLADGTRRGPNLIEVDRFETKGPPTGLSDFTKRSRNNSITALAINGMSFYEAHESIYIDYTTATKFP